MVPKHVLDHFIDLFWIGQTKHNNTKFLNIRVIYQMLRIRREKVPCRPVDFELFGATWLLLRVGIR